MSPGKYLAPLINCIAQSVAGPVLILYSISSLSIYFSGSSFSHFRNLFFNALPHFLPGCLRLVPVVGQASVQESAREVTNVFAYAISPREKQP